jgi:hypothetical protein
MTVDACLRSLGLSYRGSSSFEIKISISAEEEPSIKDQQRTLETEELKSRRGNGENFLEEDDTYQSKDHTLISYHNTPLSIYFDRGEQVWFEAPFLTMLIQVFFNKLPSFCHLSVVW